MIPERQLQDVKEMWQEHALLREGFKTKVYRDSLGKLTVGIGHLVLPADNLKFGDEISPDRVFELFDKDSEQAIDAALKQAEEIGCKTTHFIVALISVNFQLGTGWTKEFYSTYPALVDGHHEKAIANLWKSNWNKQTPVRVQDFVNAIRRIPKVPEVFPEARNPTCWQRFFYKIWNGLDSVGGKNV